MARLVDRSRRRRRRRARRLGGAGLALALVVCGVVVAGATGRSDPDPAVRVATDRSTTTAAPATSTTVPVPTGPSVLTFGAVPDDLSYSGCEDWGAVFGDEADRRVSCTFTDPTSRLGAGVRFLVDRDPATAARRQAFEREDGEALATTNSSGDHLPARFLDLGRHRIAAYGVTDVLASELPAFEDRASSTFALLLDGREVVVIVESATTAQVLAILDGLAWAPVDPALAVPDGILPAGSEPLAQGERPRWDSSTGIDPPPPTRVAGSTTGVDYQVPGQRGPVSVERTVGDIEEPLRAALRRVGSGDGQELRVGGHQAIWFDPGTSAEPGATGGAVVLVFEAEDRYLRVSTDRYQRDLPLPVAEALEG